MSPELSVVLAVVVVAGGSMLVRLLPLLAARRLPDRVGRLAGWAGASVLAALVLRSVVLHEDSTTPAPALGALAATAAAAVVAFKGRSIFVSLGSGAAAYLVLSVATSVLVRG